MQLASCQDVNTGVKSCPVVQTKNWKLIKLARLSYRRRLGGNGRDENLLWYIFRFLSGVSKSGRLLTFWFKILFPDVPPVFHTQFSEQTLREGSVVFLIFPHFLIKISISNIICYLNIRICSYMTCAWASYPHESWPSWSWFKLLKKVQRFPWPVWLVATHRRGYLGEGKVRISEVLKSLEKLNKQM